MSSRPRIPSLNDHYCQICSSSSFPSSSSSSLRPQSIRHLSCFSCEHCNLKMCYDCFENHKHQVIDGHTKIQQNCAHIQQLLDNKYQNLGQFQEHCLRSVNAAFNEIANDLESLRRESIDYVQRQFHDAEDFLSEIKAIVTPLMGKCEQNWTHESVSKKFILEIEEKRKQIDHIERCLDTFSSPKLQIKMTTYPRHKLDLFCQLLSNSRASTKSFTAKYPGKTISTRCSQSKAYDLKNEKFDAETEVEELSQNMFLSKQIQTDPVINDRNEIDFGDDDDDIYLKDDLDHIAGTRSISSQACLSTRFASKGTILTQNDVDRIASDGQHLFYYSDTSRSLCYVTNVYSVNHADTMSTTKEVSCQWPYDPIVDMVYCPISLQFFCATKTGVYTCHMANSVIKIQVKLAQIWSYVRLTTDKKYIWLWTDTPRSSQLRTYLPTTFDCIKSFNLNEYPRFLDNSTSFCVTSNSLATLFQFRSRSTALLHRKSFHLTLCDYSNLRELYTIRLGECEIDHEIRYNDHNGLLFITNGKRKLWIVNQNGQKEYVTLCHTGRALAIHNKNQIVIANGTQELQCIATVEND